MTSEHVPVLAAEVIDLTAAKNGETVVDCTFGGGGHARMLAERVSPDGLVIGIDRDPAAHSRFEDFAAAADCDTRFIHDDFENALAELADENLGADVILLDLGVSSFQIDSLDRGFSYVYDAPLDMRMDPEQDFNATDLINGWDERRLSNIFDRYGEERYSRQIARAIVRRREEHPIETTEQLVETIVNAIPTPARFGAGHPAKRVFQAVRIAVNDELGQLERALPLAWDALAVGGRMAVISFHSLEDRTTKRFFSDLATGCICPPEFPICTCGREPQAEVVSRRAISPSEGEVADNPRSRSSKLRVARKIADDRAPDALTGEGSR
ncbi:MAG: 16S rRNA (cytosine(1402)-N(4))-methyltransferase RsmH [Solirubrobacteraceae bacterium]|nr:16S rRNA (cytosine(1402)-N(4))-methyltransferase RsmH [Solirubrobacteraceae bacterium]